MDQKSTYNCENISEFSVNCPARILFDQIADKWSIMILAVLNKSPMRFNELKRRLVGISQKSLSAALKRMERNGIVARTIIDSTPPSVDYRLTPLGTALLPPFLAIYSWAYKNMAEVDAARASYDEKHELKR